MERFTKSKFRMKITKFRRQTDDEGNEKLKVVDVETTLCKGKDFSISMELDKQRGVEHKIQYVNAEPKNFQIGVIYILLDGSKVWTFIEDES